MRITFVSADEDVKQGGGGGGCAEAEGVARASSLTASVACDAAAAPDWAAAAVAADSVPLDSSLSLCAQDSRACCARSPGALRDMREGERGKRKRERSVFCNAYNVVYNISIS